MSTSDQIPRIRIDPDGLDFDTLRKEAFDRTQDLSGKIWTDYNTHDPGVTILEHLCYGLTDLSYRTEFEVQDYLAGDNNKIDYRQHALFSPEEVFPSAAVTEIDYQKVLYDAIPEIEYVWLEPYAAEGDPAPKGLYSVFVKLNAAQLQSGTEKPKQEDRSFGENSAKLEWISSVSDQVRNQLDQVGECLDTWVEALQRGRDSGSESALSERESVQLIKQLNEILCRLDRILSCIDSIWSRINNLWSVVADSLLSADLTGRFDEILLKMDAVFGYAKLSEALKNVLAFLDSDRKNSSPVEMDWLAKLTIPLSKFEHALNKLDASLQEIGNGLFTQIEPPDNAVATFDETTIKQKIQTVFLQHRNLCEDIHHIEVIHSIPFFLAGEVEVHPSHNRAKIYAEIFLKCAHCISSGIQIDRYESVFSQLGDFEQIFCGPLTNHGYISDRCFEDSQQVLGVIDLITLANQVDGVIQVKELYLIDQDNKKHTSISYDSSRYVFPDLCFPKSANPKQMLKLALPQAVSQRQSARRVPGFEPYDDTQDVLLLEETRLELKKLIFEYHAFRNSHPSLSQLIPLPKGQQRPLQEYFSIQNHFPAIYGINRYGIPLSKPLEIQARAKQLKAYLFPFEQLMADYLQNLHEIPRLFSLDSKHDQSYFSRILDDRNIPDIESLYVGNKECSQTLLATLLARYDDYADRKNRLLDTLLAMHGEQYPQALLLQFDRYWRKNPDKWILDNKINYLKCIREITRDRALGYNYLEPAMRTADQEVVENMAGAHQRINILLGLTQFNSIPSITAVLLARGCRLIPDRVFAQGVNFLSEALEQSAVSIFPEEEKFTNLSIPSTLPPLGYAIFKEGAELRNYRLVTSGGKTFICLKTVQFAHLWPLEVKDSQDEAIRYAHEFCHALTQLSIACEGFHLIEHVLLRPRGYDQPDDSPGAAFFDFRVSVIFPSWTARFSNPAFRKFAEETVLKNLPAHVFPEFYWLDFVYMQDFERRYRIWLDCMRLANQNPVQESLAQLNDASKRIISFLIKNRKGNSTERWI
ncbi:hypothetical protein [Nitrosomonas sp.]|uniref:hypothetical protein n=1 Tax=Nitrosomonas sp. TaxID=42353 RepID=UPI001D4D9C28|nr:hypothetical protein [Nitrosomonas sp.]MBX3616328.1 hypothetical protein [Nitrosomonas sp.]